MKKCLIALCLSVAFTSQAKSLPQEPDYMDNSVVREATKGTPEYSPKAIYRLCQKSSLKVFGCAQLAQFMYAPVGTVSPIAHLNTQQLAKLTRGVADKDYYLLNLWDSERLDRVRASLPQLERTEEDQHSFIKWQSLWDGYRVHPDVPKRHRLYQWLETIMGKRLKMK